jgi:hypothetical protein
LVADKDVRGVLVRMGWLWRPGKTGGGSAELGVQCRRARPPTANWRTLRANQLHATANTLPP